MEHEAFRRSGFSELHTNGIICSSVIQERQSAPLLLLALREYPKFRSVVALSAARLPVLDIMLLNRWTPDIAELVQRFLSQHQVARVLVRSESHGGLLGSPSRQGVGIRSIGLAVSQLLRQRSDIIVGIQIAGDIHKNLYNLNMLIDPWKPGRILFEVSGPGFTARDLNRFGIVHERIELPSFATTLTESLVRRLFQVSDRVYEKQRGTKIDELGKITLDQENALILTHATYSPIPIGYLRTIWSELANIRTAVDWLGLSRRGAIVSLSFILQTGNYASHFYWDVHPMT